MVAGHLPEPCRFPGPPFWHKKAANKEGQALHNHGSFISVRAPEALRGQGTRSVARPRYQKRCEAKVQHGGRRKEEYFYGSGTTRLYGHKDFILDTKGFTRT